MALGSVTGIEGGISSSFKSECTFNESYARANFLTNGHMVVMSYQGESKSHSTSEVIFTIPTKYLPAEITNDQYYFLYAINALGVGEARFRNDGSVELNTVPTTSSGRVYFHICYFIK